MAYTIVRSDGTVLTSISDGTINTTSTSLGLPGRNYPGYGQTVDTNFVHLMESFADSTPPPNPLRGQLWYNTNDSTLNVCPTDGEANAAAWVVLATTSGTGTTTFGNVTVTGNITANNATIAYDISANSVTTNYLSVSANANIANANLTGTTTASSITTTSITSGSQSTNGTLTGVWTANGAGTANGVAGTSMWVTGGNLVITGAGSIGIKTDNFYYANGDPISFTGSYSNSNVASYLPTYNGNILTVQTQATTLTTGANTTAGTLTGNWTLSTGSQLAATSANTVVNASQPNITSVGTLSGLTVTGAASLGNVSLTSLSLNRALENWTVSATAASGVINYDALTQTVLYYTNNASGNWTMNFRGNSSVTLNSVLSTGQSVTVVFISPIGSTAYYNNLIRVDSNIVTVKYQGGTAWTTGDVNSTNIYTYVILKTASSTFTVFASQSKF